jgi:hypothetical protein
MHGTTLHTVSMQFFPHLYIAGGSCLEALLFLVRSPLSSLVAFRCLLFRDHLKKKKVPVEQ